MKYNQYADGFSPAPTYLKNCLLAFAVGGAICETGYLIKAGIMAAGSHMVYRRSDLRSAADYRPGLVQYPRKDRRCRSGCSYHRVCKFRGIAGAGI